MTTGQWFALASLGCSLSAVALVLTARQIGYDKPAATVLTHAGNALAICALLLAALGFLSVLS